MKVRAIFLGILALAPASGACKKKEESLSLVVWKAMGRRHAHRRTRPRSAEVARVSS